MPSGLSEMPENRNSPMIDHDIPIASGSLWLSPLSPLVSPGETPCHPQVRRQVADPSDATKAGAPALMEEKEVPWGLGRNRKRWQET